ncbi:MAG: hypothetical protein WC917_02970 [Bacilli bacterium]|jgi:hypothetical protein
MEKVDYIEDYLAFESNFKRTQVSPEEVGELIMHMTAYFIRYNVRLGEAIKRASIIKANLQNQSDPITGKSMSSSKAGILADATPEAHMYEMARIHVTNIQEIINSMKVLQKSLTLEYSNSNL